MQDILIDNIILPNKPLSNFELEDAVKKLKIKNFRGVFLRAALPKKVKNKECGILNLDDSSGPGTHWVAWYKNGKTKIYLEVRDYLKTPIHYNSDQLQQAGQVFCGHLCLYILKELGLDNKFQNILNKLF